MCVLSNHLLVFFMVDCVHLQVDALSELFVAWDDILAETENKVTKLERDREERQRLGYE
jgi:hypothetical protein